MTPKLTICIPSYNRGQAALRQVLHTLPLIEPDWEILVLDNCSFQNLEGYREIEFMSKLDHRLKYVKHAQNLGFHGNVLACIKSVTTPYLQIISDEDYANSAVVRDAISTLDEFPEVGLIRGSIGPINGMVPRNSKVYPDQFLKAGRSALGEFSLSTNYLSGIIYNRQLLAELQIVRKFEDGLANNPMIAAYAHMYLDILTAASCSVITSREIVCFEGVEESCVPNAGPLAEALPYTFAGRLEQIIGFRDAFREACGPDNLGDLSLLVHLYLRLVDKYWLLFHVDSFLFTSRGLRLDDLRESLLHFFHAASGIDEFSFVQDVVRGLVDECARSNLRRLNGRT